MNTPENITDLKPGEFFVFGSNAEGQHWGGAAALAHAQFGAEWGVGEGITGQCYALPTMTGLTDLHAAVKRLLVVAHLFPDARFLVTRVGCGIAGHTPADVAPAFRGHPENIILPADFQTILEGASA